MPHPALERAFDFGQRSCWDSNALEVVEGLAFTALQLRKTGHTRAVRGARSQSPLRLTSNAEIKENGGLEMTY